MPSQPIFLVTALALILTSACTSKQSATSTQTKPPVPGEIQATSGDVRIQTYAIAGAPQDPGIVVVINGGPGASHESVAHLARLAAAGVRVVAYDQRGLGRSSAPSDDAHYAIADQVSDLDAVRAAFHVNKLAIVGHSFGGLVAMAYAAKYPDRVASLVLISPMAPDWTDYQTSNEHFEARTASLAQAGTITEPPSPDGDDCRATSRAVLPVLFADPSLPRTLDLAESRDTQCSVKVQSATFATLAKYDVRAGLGAFTGPALVVVGASDPFGDAPSRIAAAALGSKPATTTIARSGHFPWIENEAAFDDAVLPFLRAHRSE